MSSKTLYRTLLRRTTVTLPLLSYWKSSRTLWVPRLLRSGCVLVDQPLVFPCIVDAWGVHKWDIDQQVIGVFYTKPRPLAKQGRFFQTSLLRRTNGTLRGVGSIVPTWDDSVLSKPCTKTEYGQTTLKIFKPRPLTLSHNLLLTHLLLTTRSPLPIL